MPSISKKNEFDKRFNSMKSEADKYSSAWRDLSEYINPTRGLFTDSSSKRGKMIDHKKILDSHATQSCRKSASGLNSGITSKSRPWFRLTLSSEELMKMPGVRMWLDDVQKRMYAILERSNLYGAFQTTYEELLTFGTGCFILLEDINQVIRARSFTIGEYYLGIDHTGKVNSFARSFQMTVAQVVKQFGLESVSPQVKAKWDTNQVDSEIKVRHLIEPNDTKDPMMADFKNMPWRSVYWEEGEGGEDFLATRGFKRFNVVAPRWSVPTTDMVYGYGPGWDALGDVKELQKTKYDKLLAQEKLHNPPMQSDASITGFVNLLPGGVTKASGNVPNAGLRPAYEINPNLESFIELIKQTKQAIDKHFFTDLFTMLATLDRTQITAHEIAAREQERIMLMGPILNALDEEMLSRVIEILFDIMIENQLIAPPPEEIEGQELRIQYISILAQAQRAVGATSIQNVIGFVGGAMTLDPSVVDVLNLDEATREIAEMEGIPAKILNDPELVEAIREEKARQANMQTAMAGVGPAADATKKLADSQMGQDSALDRIMKGATQ